MRENARTALPAEINVLWSRVICGMSCRVVAKGFGTLQEGETALFVERTAVLVFYFFLREGGKSWVPNAFKMSCVYCCSCLVCIVVVVLCYCCSCLVCIVVVVLCVLLLVVLCALL